MSTLKISENEPYIITLDSIDLKYIHTNINNNMAGVTPLWNCSRKNYYEFAVVIDSEFDEETDIIDDIACQICNLCNIDIPIIFFEDHCNSEKHKTFQEITKTALERAAKSIDACCNINKTNINNDIYYCASCSVAVLKKHELIHDKTKQHLASNEYDENIRSLMKLYINENKSCINSRNSNKNDVDEKNMSFKDNVEMNVKNDNKEMNKQIMMKNDTEKNTPKRNNEEMIMKYCVQENIAKNNAGRRNFKNDNKEMTMKNVNDTVGTSNMSENVQEMTKFVSHTGHTIPYNDGFITLPKYSYHGFRTYGNTIYCGLCHCSLNQSVDTHIKSYKHRLQCEKPLKYYCIRQVDTRLSHCVVCNLKIGTNDAEEHAIENPDHNKLVEEYITTNVKKQSIASTQNKRAYKTNHITYTSKPKFLKCDLCNIKLPNTEQNVKEHIQALRHNENLLKSKTYRYYCCECNWGFDDLIVHTFDKHRLSK